MRTATTADLEGRGELLSRGEFFWLDLLDPSPQTVDAMGEILDLHELAVEDSREFCQRPKVDRYGDQLLLVYYGATLDEQNTPKPVEVHLHISPQFVVTVHRGRCRRFDTARRDLDAADQ